MALVDTTSEVVDRAEGLESALVVVHEAQGAILESHAWDAFISGREPVRFAHVSDLNKTLRELGIRRSSFMGIRGCDTSQCALAAESATMRADAEGWHFTRSCGDHQGSDTADEGYLPGGPVYLRATYSRRSPLETADLAWALLSREVPSSLFRQPACAACRQRVAPDLELPLSWHGADGRSACPAGSEHAVASGEPAAMISRYARSAA